LPEELNEGLPRLGSVKTATKPSQPIEKSTAGASLLAQAIVSKIADHLPVHRQAKILKRFGVEFADQTMCGWMRQCAELLDPLYARLKQFVLSSEVIDTDDTPVKVLDRSLARTTRKGRFWPYLGDRNHVAAVFDYTPTRERAGPEMFLKHYRGYLQADAYVAYDSFFTDPVRGLAEVACWAYTDAARMGAVLAYIAQLYTVEKRARRSGVEARSHVYCVSFSAGAHAVARVSVENSRSGIAEERSGPSRIVRTEELGRADALLRGWRSGDRQ
jgi:transposase